MNRGHDISSPLENQLVLKLGCQKLLAGVTRDCRSCRCALLHHRRAGRLARLVGCGDGTGAAPVIASMYLDHECEEVRNGALEGLPDWHSLGVMLLPPELPSSGARGVMGGCR
jgi:hypothetical protein